MHTIHRTIRLLTMVCLLGVFPVQAGITIGQVRNLPPLPAIYVDEPSFDTRIQWLKQRLADSADAAEQYRYQRSLFQNYYDERKTADAAATCQKNVPLREDVIYREHCILMTVPAYADHMPMLLALAHDARQIPNMAAAAQVLKDVAWRQSQAGDIAGAFENFEAALSAAPSDAVELLGDIMMDTAASYIVNGDEGYVRKGIALLETAREQMERALKNTHDRSNKALLKDNVLLTEFNSGIAYTLHLADYEAALRHFDQVNGEANPYREDALVFSALAAAQLKQFDRSKAYLVRADKEKSGDSVSGQVVQRYLTCYRQLAIRHWAVTQSVSACLNLKPETAAEVQLDIFKRLSQSDDVNIALAGLKGLKELFINTLEPQLRRRGSSAASNAELKRLQRESELKSVVLKQQDDLQRERDATYAQRQNYFLALSLLLVMVALLIASQWRAKKKLAEQFERLSVIDTLTQLGNRRYLEQHITRELLQT